MNLLRDFEKQHRKIFWNLVGYISVGIIGGVDYLTGYEIAFSLFYLIPISLIAWFVGKQFGIIISCASASVWLLADVSAGSIYAHPLIYVWNTLIRLSFFLIVVFLLTGLRGALDNERKLSRVDGLTGATNYRYFSELLQNEIDRCYRYKHPFTLAYIDVDDFKKVNDQFGHSIGDQVLQTIVDYTRKALRKTDIIGRLGGDEFAVLFPETNQEAATTILSRIQPGLLQEMGQTKLPITFSIGVLTWNRCPTTTDEVVKLVDDLMYSVKKDGKNGIAYSTYSD